MHALVWYKFLALYIIEKHIADASSLTAFTIGYISISHKSVQ